MVRSICRNCGGAFWETYKGARAETSDHGSDLCDECESSLKVLKNKMAYEAQQRDGGHLDKAQADAALRALSKA